MLSQKLSGVVETANALPALPRLDDEPPCAGRKPLLAFLDQLSDDLVREGAPVLVAQFEVDAETMLSGHAHDIIWCERALGEPVAAFDALEANSSTQGQVVGKRPLRNGDLVRTASRACEDTVTAGRRDLRAGGRFAGYDPARHGDLEAQHQMRALLQVTLERGRRASRIEYRRCRRSVFHADSPQVAPQVTIRVRQGLHLPLPKLESAPAVARA